MGKKSKTKVGIDLDQYTFLFANTFKNPTSKDVLKKYLTRCHNLEPLEFLDALSQYKMDIDNIHDKYFQQINSNNTTNNTTAASVAQQPEDTNTGGVGAKEDLDVTVYREIHQQFREKASQLMDKFLTAKGKREINVSSMVKASLRSEFEKLHKDFEDFEKGIVNTTDVAVTAKKYSLKQQHYNLFSSIESVVMNELQLDVFPRFVRSELWIQFLRSHAQLEDLLSQIALKRNAVEYQKLLYTYEDFNNPVITDQDFDSLSYFLQDSPKWKLRFVANEDGPVEERSYFYTMNENFIVGTNLPKYMRNRRLTKIVTYLPCDAMDAVDLIFSAEYSTGTDKTCIKVAQTDYCTVDKAMNRKYAQTLVDFHYKLFPKPADLRLLRYTLSLAVDPKDTTHMYLVGRTNKPDLETPDGYSAASCYCGYSFKQVERHLTRFTQILSMNFGGKIQNMPAWMNNGIMDHLYLERTKNYSAGLKTAVLDRKQKGWQKVTETYGRVQTLYENCSNLNKTFKLPDDGDISDLSIWDFQNKSLKPPSHIMRHEEK
jgi:hypothetical protein